ACKAGALPTELQPLIAAIRARLPGARPRLQALVGLDGFEPSTPALSRRCSNQLSYRPASGILSPPPCSRRQQPISVGTWKRLEEQLTVNLRNSFARC